MFILFNFILSSGREIIVYVIGIFDFFFYNYYLYLKDLKNIKIV